jgi:ABC-type protease/lipase transport system fused ATPase/permease subunit
VDLKQERVKDFKRFVVPVNHKSMAISILDNIMMMDETMMSYITPQTKKAVLTRDRERGTSSTQARVHYSCFRRCCPPSLRTKG